jgi:hypothetical protein
MSSLWYVSLALWMRQRFGGNDTNETSFCRMRSLLLVLILMRRRLNSFPRDAGVYQATRYVLWTI